MTAKPKKLSAKQERFVTEYIIDLNATQAAIRAGYSPKTAQEQSSRLLSNVMVAEAVAEAKAKRAEKTGITAERVLRELELLAFSDHTHFQVDARGVVTLAEGAPAGAHRAVSSIKRKITSLGDGEGVMTQAEVEIRLWDKPGPLRLAGRHVGLFPDRIEVSGPNGGPIQSETTTPKTSSDMRRELGELVGKPDGSTKG